jgi:cyclophilin family peptidyl-prolyl cis-trans isomerase
MSHSDGSSEDDANEANAEADAGSFVDEMIPTSRRSLLQKTATGTAAAVLASLSLVELAPPATAVATSSLPTTATTAAATTTDPSDAAVTHKVFMTVRISRQDGTFYVRDDLPDIPENKVFSGRLVIRLFGKNAPLAVERFLSYIVATGSADDDVDNPKPSYSRSSFNSFDEGTGLLRGGKIASLEVTDINGSTALRYGGRLVPALLWIEGRGSGSGGSSTKTTTELPPRVSHSAKGLLTHKILDITPEFSITTRSDSTFLDGSSTVFGQLQIDDVSKDFLNIVKDLPTYKVDRAAQFMPSTPAKEMPLDDAAQAIFNAQRAFFRKAAKSAGDTRIDKVFEGKLLRRVEVTQVGLM